MVLVMFSSGGKAGARFKHSDSAIVELLNHVQRAHVKKQVILYPINYEHLGQMMECRGKLLVEVA